MNRIFEKRVVPAAIIDNAADAAPLAEAMLAGGMDIIEVTFRTDGAADAIREISRRFPEMLVGAGTILSLDQLKMAADAGSRYIVAPGLNPDTVRAAGEMGVPIIPGVVTPTEIEAAMRLDLDLLKFFPAQAMGGAATLKALAGPYAHTGLRFLPTGGIDAANCRDYLALPVVAAVGGSWMIKASLVSAGKWTEITELCRSAVELCSGKSA